MEKTRSGCGSNMRHWFQGEKVCKRCDAPNPDYREPPPVKRTQLDDRIAALLGFTRQLAEYDCADVSADGESQCDAIDIATGKSDGRCATCEARHWLQMNRKWIERVSA